MVKHQVYGFRIGRVTSASTPEMAASKSLLAATELPTRAAYTRGVKPALVSHTDFL